MAEKVKQHHCRKCKLCKVPDAYVTPVERELLRQDGCVDKGIEDGELESNLNKSFHYGRFCQCDVQKPVCGCHNCVAGTSDKYGHFWGND